MTIFIDITASQIRELREEHLHLSQSEFASLVGVSERTVQNWESGSRPRPAHRRALIALFRQDAA